ncbi:hypothetical protein APA_3477 [Pseudanabaena sp. lw0831]|nr:hypothetical protein APA_3477 [Pseudanabaena sp. lw0831]
MKKVKVGAVSAEVSIEISAGINIISTITKSSAENLELEESKEAYVVIKASDVIVVID